MNETKQKYEDHVIEMAKANRDDLRQKFICGATLTTEEINKWELYNEILGEE